MFIRSIIALATSVGISGMFYLGYNFAVLHVGSKMKTEQFYDNHAVKLYQLSWRLADGSALTGDEKKEFEIGNLNTVPGRAMYQYTISLSGMSEANCEGLALAMLRKSLGFPNMLVNKQSSTPNDVSVLCVEGDNTISFSSQ